MGGRSDACGKFGVPGPQLILDLGLGPAADDDPVPAAIWLPADRDRPGPAILAPVVVDRIFTPGTALGLSHGSPSSPGHRSFLAGSPIACTASVSSGYGPPGDPRGLHQSRIPTRLKDNHASIIAGRESLQVLAALRSLWAHKVFTRADADPAVDSVADDLTRARDRRNRSRTGSTRADHPNPESGRPATAAARTGARRSPPCPAPHERHGAAEQLERRARQRVLIRARRRRHPAGHHYPRALPRPPRLHRPRPRPSPGTGQGRPEIGRSQTHLPPGPKCPVQPAPAATSASTPSPA